MRLRLGEQFREGREAGVDRIAAHVNDARVRKDEMDQPHELDIAERLVGDPFGRRRPCSEPGDILGGERAELLRRR